LKIFSLPGVLIALLAAAPAIAADLSDGERQAVCGERGSCTVVAISNAGAGQDGESLRIAEIVLGLADLPEHFPEEGCRSTEAALSGEALDGGREIWLLAGDAAPRLLLPLCNDGYGAAGMGEDTIEVGPNQLVHSQYGGSAWRWSSVKTIRLSPLKVTREEGCSYHNVAPGSGESFVVNRDTFEARSFAFATEGKSENELSIGCPTATADFTQPLDPTPDAETLAAYALPAPFSLDAAQLPEGTTLGTCSLSLMSDGSKGLLVHGEPAAKADAAELRVIAETPNSLLIQIRDPLAARETTAATWVKAPHVEIWSSRVNELYEGDPTLPQLEYDQIGVTLDGEVHAGIGKLERQPTVKTWSARDEQERAVTVMRIGWETESGLPSGLGVVYSQAEGGKQARLVSSAPIVRNRPLYLPGIWSTYPEETGIPNGECEFSGDSLQLDL
jgi:hypothetical protein